MTDPQGPREEVNLQINDDEDPARVAQNDNIRQRLRNFTISSITNVLTPLVEHVNNSQLAPMSWLNGGNPPGETAPVAANNVSLTIINQNENGLALSVDIHREDAAAENGTEAQSEPPQQNPDADPEANAFPRIQDENNAQNNRTVDLNVGEYIPTLLKCTIFVLILTIKFMYDHLEGVITFAVMQLVFMFIGDEQINLRTKSPLRALIGFAVTVKCLQYILTYEGLPTTLTIYNPHFVTPESIWDLIWIIYMNDCVLQFAAMGTKLIFKCLPLKIMSFKTKLKVYSFFEAAFQLYRTTAPTQAWVSYFLDSYRGNDYILSLFLSATYILVKLFDCSRKFIFFSIATKKLFTRSGLISMSKEQLASKGIKCSICLDDFEFPIQLSCQHVFCSTCIQQWSVKNRTCPLCRTPMNEDFASANITSTVLLQIF